MYKVKFINMNRREKLNYMAFWAGIILSFLGGCMFLDAVGVLIGF